jgi:hypothetical protein
MHGLVRFAQDFHKIRVSEVRLDTPPPHPGPILNPMTDHHAGYTVTLEADIREDTAEATLSAIRQIRGVLDVQPVTATAELDIAESRANHTWRRRLLDLAHASLTAKP